VRLVPPGLLAGLLLVPGLLEADSGRVVSPAAGERLLSGDVVEVRWEEPPAGAEEGELLLSLDGGARVPLRLGPRLDPSARSTWWTVPAFPAGAASLTLRVGVEGREVECVPSGSFEIVSRPGSTPASLLFRDDEWWVAVETLPALPVPRLGSSRNLLPWADRHSLALLLEDRSQPGEVSAGRPSRRPSPLPDPVTPCEGGPSASLLLSLPRRE